jgi:clan AA aspartic protease
MIGTDGSIVFWEPRVAIEVAGISMDFRLVETVVDTGFNGALALPGDIIEELGLTHQGERRTRLATGSGSVPIYGAVASWLGDLRAVFVHRVEGNPLLGTALLTNCLLTVDFREGGEVSIQPHWLNAVG